MEPPVFIDERQDVQKKTFTKWINAHLSKTTCPPVKDLFVDLRDGHRLLALLEVLTNVKYKREKGRMRVHHINNLNKTLQVLQENGVKLLNISSEDIAAGNTKLTLGLIWLIALSFDGHKLVNSQSVNGLEKSLLNWVNQFTDAHGLRINDFSGSWSDGRAFLFILNGNVPDFDLANALSLHPIARLRKAFDLGSRHLHIDQLLDPEDVNTNKPDKKSILMYVMCLYHAIDARKMNSVHELAQYFGSADEIQLLDEEKEMERRKSSSDDRSADGEPVPTTTTIIPKPLHVGNLTDLDDISLGKSTEDVSKLGSPIHRSATFTISTKNENNLKTENNDTINQETVSSRPVSTATNASIQIGGYQNAIEVVLTLLLEAEDVLSKDMADVTELAEAQAQFQEHEEFMIKLSEYQQYVGSALEEGARLIAESQHNFGLTVEDQSEIKQQMFLLNERWETLRMRALAVQSRVHATLAKVQLLKIEELRTLLTNTEDRISRMSEVACAPEMIKAQLVEQIALEKSLDDRKSLVDGLSNLVVIVNDESFNDLEDKLTALGERWAHVLKWTKNRMERLQDANNKWTQLTTHYTVIGRWMDAREHDLKAMERNEVTEIGSVMKRINDLNYCAKDLDVLTEYLGMLEQTAQQLAPASAALLENLENLGDRSDALKQILEIQQSRIEGMGFKFPVKARTSAPLERPESWFDFQGRFDSGNLDEVLAETTEMSPQSSKKRKLHTPEQYRELGMKIQELIAFVRDTDEKLRLFDEVKVKQQSAMLVQLSADVNHRIDEFQQVQALLRECKQLDVNQSLADEEQQIADIASKYDELRYQIDDLNAKHKITLANDKLHNSLTGFKLVLADCRDWFKQHANIATREDLENRLAYMESLSPEIDESKTHWNSVRTSDMKEWKHDFDQFYESWLDMKSAIRRIVQEDSQHDDVGDMRRQLEDFIEEAEERYVIISEMDKMNENLEQLEELKLRYAQLQDTYNFVCENGSQSSQLDDVCDVWDKLPTNLNERIIKQTTAIESLNHFNGEYATVSGVLERLEQHLRDDVILPGEMQVLQNLRTKYERYGREIKKIEIDIISVKNFSEIIVKDSEDDHKGWLLRQIRALNESYARITDLFQANSKRLHQVITQTEDIVQRVVQTELWLNDLEMNTPKNANADILNSNELFQIKTKFQTLKETCEQRTVNFRELNEVGSEILLQIDDMIQHKADQKYSHLAKQFTKLNARWNDVTSLVYNRTALLEHVSSQLGEFKTLMVSETGYLDKLEKCLRKSPENAADSEEIYEELDDLENNIRNHSDERLEKIQEIGSELVEHNIMTDSISEEVQRITERWNQLQHQAKKREQMLEKAVSEAQTSESRITTLQHWISRVDNMLKEHEENDTTMDDLPHDFQRLIEEFGSNEELLKQMRQEVETYQQNGKLEAANRLNDQVNLLEDRFKVCQKKFSRFTSPHAGFESRLNRALGELRNVERNSCILDVVSAGPSNVQDQYQHCLKMYRTLSEIKAEIETVIKTGRKVCEDKTTKNPKKLGLSIDALKHLYNALGEHVTQSKNILEKLLKMSTTLADNFARAERMLGEQADGNGNAEEMGVDVDTLLNQCNAIYDKYVETCEPTYLEDVRVRIDELSTRHLQSSDVDVVKRLNELKATLHNLDNISLDKLRTVEKDLQSVDTTNSMVHALHRQVSDIVQDAISSKTRPRRRDNNHTGSSMAQDGSNSNNTEIVIVSNTVRQRRARTPLTNENVESDRPVELPSPSVMELPAPPPSPTKQSLPVLPNQQTSSVMPDLLPTTFRLAESSALFSQISDNNGQERPDSIYEYVNESPTMNADHEQFSVVEIRESNLTPKMSIRHMDLEPKLGEIVNTISILESVDTFEPEFVETVNIIDASEPSDTDTCCSTPNRLSADCLDTEQPTGEQSPVPMTPSPPEPLSPLQQAHNNADGQHTRRQLQPNTSIMLVAKRPITSAAHHYYRKERDLLKDCDEQEDRMRTEAKLKMKQSLVPNLKEILCTPERDSFYNSDKEHNDEPLVFSEDEDIPRFSLEMTPDIDSDSDTSRIEMPNSTTKPDSRDATKFVDTNGGHTSLEQRVFDFDKTAQYMIKKLIATCTQIEQCTDGSEGVDHLKLSIAPDAATLISQGDSLVLETHGKATELSNTVMQTQTLLREKFRDMKNAQISKATRLSVDELQKAQNLQKENQNFPREKQFVDKLLLGAVLKENDGEIDAGADVVREVQKLRSFMAEPIGNEENFPQRVAAIKHHQQHLQAAMDALSNGPSSPQAKNAMEALENVRKDLSAHCDAVFQTMDISKRNRKAGGDAAPSLEQCVQPLSSLKVPGEPTTTWNPESSNSRDTPYVPGSFASKAKSKFFSSAGPTVLDSSFDKSVLQISDWLNLEQDMLKKHIVDVGNVDAIVEAVDKQKDVLRELEFKKPQLDELVQTAESLKTDVNRKQLQNKVTRLREHWDETSQCVLQRKSQLTSMLGDSQRYEAKRLEIEAWLSRMENRSERMGGVATTADVLEAQQKEQKSFHAELHQYKHQIELFSQLTQKLIKVYPTDDTSRIKRMTESVNLRYNNLNNGVINRGKLLHAAVHNLQSFDRTMDQFLAWLSEAESLCENAEQEIDRNPHVLKVSTNSN